MVFSSIVKTLLEPLDFFNPLGLRPFLFFRDEGTDGLNGVGLGGRFILAPAIDPRKSDGKAGLVAGAAIDALKSEFENLYRLDDADGPVPFLGVLLNPAVQSANFFVR
jgi:hypothetical protein